MSVKDELITKAKEILDNKFDFEEVAYVPDITDKKLTFGNKGLQFEATVLYIDMRGSTEILNKHNNPVVAKIHMVYFHTIVKIAKEYGGEVRSMLVFFQGTSKLTLSNAVITAMKMKYMISNTDSGLNPLLEKYSAIDFGIGLDDGKILCTKIGLGGDSNNQDLIWISNAVNKAVAISDLCMSPNSIAISSYVYGNLIDKVKYHLKNIYGQEQKIDMWNQKYFQYNGTTEFYYDTNYYWTVS